MLEQVENNITPMLSNMQISIGQNWKTSKGNKLVKINRCIFAYLKVKDKLDRKFEKTKKSSSDFQVENSQEKWYGKLNYCVFNQWKTSMHR